MDKENTYNYKTIIKNNKSKCTFSNCKLCRKLYIDVIHITIVNYVTYIIF